MSTFCWFNRPSHPLPVFPLFFLLSQCTVQNKTWIFLPRRRRQTFFIHYYYDVVVNDITTKSSLAYCLTHKNIFTSKQEPEPLLQIFKFLTLSIRKLQINKNMISWERTVVSAILIKCVLMRQPSVIQIAKD